MAKMVGDYRQVGGVWWTAQVGYYSRAGDKLVYVAPLPIYSEQFPPDGYHTILVSYVANIHNFEDVMEVFSFNSQVGAEWIDERELFTDQVLGDWDKPMPYLFEKAKRIFEEVVDGSFEEGWSLRDEIVKIYERLLREGKMPKSTAIYTDEDKVKVSGTFSFDVLGTAS